MHSFSALSRFPGGIGTLIGVLRRKLGFTECYTRTRCITGIHTVGFELICLDEANEGWNSEPTAPEHGRPVGD
jgi:hypothetical protein